MNDLLRTLVYRYPRRVLLALVDTPSGEVHLPTWFDETRADSEEYRRRLRPLAGADVIEYDERAGIVSRGPAFDRATPLVRAIDEVASGSDVVAERDQLALANRSLRHELLGSLTLVRERVDTMPDEGTVHRTVVERRLEELIDRVETIGAFTDTVLDDDADLRPLDLDDAIYATVSTVRDRHDARLHVESVPDVTVYADDRFPLAVENLLRNAVEHSDCETPEVRVRCDHDGDRATVRIADDGPGMPDYRKRAVAGNGAGVEHNGTGFGLHFVKRTVDAYGGDLDVEDRDPRGTVVRVALPVA